MFWGVLKLVNNYYLTTTALTAKPETVIRKQCAGLDLHKSFCQTKICTKEGELIKEGVGLLLLLNMEIEEYKMVYGSWDEMGKRFAEAKKGSLAAADKIFDGSNR